MQVRRVVTGHDEKGRAVFVQDGKVDAFTLPGAGDLARVWCADAPSRYPDNGEEPGGEAFFPSLGGVRMMVMEFSVQDGVAEVHASEEVAANAKGLSDTMDEEAGFHTTDTTDFAIIVSGTVVLELDDGAEVVLGPGEVAVQNGTRHRWRNGGDTPATMATFSVGAHRA